MECGREVEKGGKLREKERWSVKGRKRYENRGRGMLGKENWRRDEEEGKKGREKGRKRQERRKREGIKGMKKRERTCERKGNNYGKRKAWKLKKRKKGNKRNERYKKVEFEDKEKRRGVIREDKEK